MKEKREKKYFLFNTINHIYKFGTQLSLDWTLNQHSLGWALNQHEIHVEHILTVDSVMAQI